MGTLTEEEKARIAEEEEVRSQVRRKYEQKSSGTAGVLSTLCPGLGQIYNGQVGKGSLFFLLFFAGITILSIGTTLLVKGPSGGASSFNIASKVSSGPPVEMNEEGIVPEEMAAETQKAVEKETQDQAKAEKDQANSQEKAVLKSLGLILLGALVMVITALLAIRDAIRTARRKNQTPAVT